MTATQNTTRTESFIPVNAHASTPDLQAHLEEFGYAYVPSLVPNDDVLRVRRAVLEECAPAGWLDASRELMDGIANPHQALLGEGNPAYMAVYRKILRREEFRDFPAHPAITSRLLGVPVEDVLVHPCRIGRVTFPQNVGATTPAHQDWLYIRGSEETYTIWMPLGDCPVDLGGLAVWPGSQHGGLREHDQKIEGATGGSGVLTHDAPVWHTGDFACGDALVFQSLTIHKALPNQTPDRLRLSTDNRFQRKAEDVDPSSLRSHFDL